MKKMIFSGCVILIFVSMVFVSYAAMTKEPISPTHLSDFKGKWEGWKTTTGQDLRAGLEIYNDSLPLKGKLTFDVQRRGAATTTNTSHFNEGTINNDGNLYIKWGQHYVELSLYKGDGKMKLEGDFRLAGSKGTMTFNKK